MFLQMQTCKSNCVRSRFQTNWNKLQSTLCKRTMSCPLPQHCNDACARVCGDSTCMFAQSLNSRAWSDSDLTQIYSKTNSKDDMLDLFVRSRCLHEFTTSPWQLHIVNSKCTTCKDIQTSIADNNFCAWKGDSCYHSKSTMHADILEEYENNW